METSVDWNKIAQDSFKPIWTIFLTETISVNQASATKKNDDFMM